MVCKILNGRYETANVQGADLSEKLTVLYSSNTSSGLNSIKHSQSLSLYAGATVSGTGFRVFMAYDFNKK